MADDFYRLLDCRADADADALRRAYRRQMRLHHPDAGSGDAGERAIRINEAYDVLRNPGSRARYDRDRTARMLAEKARLAGGRPLRRERIVRTAERAPPPPGKTGPNGGNGARPLSMFWLVICFVVLTLPFLYGMWINS